MALVQPMPGGRVVGALACQNNSYLQSLKTEVVSCVKYSPPKSESTSKKTKGSKTEAVPDTWLIEFADSVFFPEGGGQPSDQGTIVPLSTSSEPIPVKYAQRQGLRCVLHSPQPLEPGSSVRQDIDFQTRWDHMQQHTGQHLLSAIMDAYDNLETLGWGMGSNGSMSYVDLPRKPTDEELQTIQEKCNKAISNNHAITVETPDDAEKNNLPSDYDKELGVVRVINIKDIDRNTCCGTHLSQTSHISLILLHHTQPIHSIHTRLYFSCGERAIRLSGNSISGLRSVAKLLACGSEPQEIMAFVGKNNDALAELRREKKKLLAEIARFEAERVKGVLRNGKRAWVHRVSEGLEFFNTVLFEVKEEVKGGLVVCASGEGKEGGMVVIVGAPAEVEAMVGKIKGVVSSIKGGGKGERWQGKLLEWKKGELEALRKLM